MEDKYFVPFYERAYYLTNDVTFDQRCTDFYLSIIVHKQHLVEFHRCTGLHVFDVMNEKARRSFSTLNCCPCISTITYILTVILLGLPGKAGLYEVHLRSPTRSIRCKGSINLDVASNIETIGRNIDASYAASMV